MACMNEMPAGEYKTHFDCATAGYLNAMGLMRELGEAEVNRSQITVQFKCVMSGSPV
tara:strand:+ start:1799 stop:1969 length:171 start_codon:yes stop_codon:yes gene_type:complete